MNLSIGLLHAWLPGSCEVEQNFKRKMHSFFFVQINATAVLMNPQMLQKHPKLRYQEMPLQTGSIT